MRNKVIHCGIFHKCPKLHKLKKQYTLILNTFRTRGACLVLLSKNCNIVIFLKIYKPMHIL